MKILWLAHEGDISGANICLLEFIELLKQHNIESSLIVPFSSKKGFAKAAIKQQIKVSELKFYSWTSASPDFRYPFKTRLQRWVRNKLAIRKIRNIIKKVDPDYVVTNTIVSPVAAFAAKTTGKKHIWFIHEFGEEDHGFSINGDFSKGAAKMNSLSYKIVFISAAIQQKYKDLVPENKTFIVTNAVLMPFIATGTLPVNGFNLMILGQIAESKNHIEAFKALEICNRKGARILLNIVGRAQDPSFLEWLVIKAEELGLKEQIRFLGPMEMPAHLLRQQHALIMCSKMEAFGRATVEALKLGVPVIAANKGGSLEIIKNGSDGYFYDSGNEKDLADKIMLLHKNYAGFDKKEISKRAKERFNGENTYQQLLEVFS